MIDAKSIAANEVLAGGEEIHRQRTGTVIGHLVLLCPLRAASPNGNHRAGGTVGGAPFIGARS